jgi:hypothetical protein
MNLRPLSLLCVAASACLAQQSGSLIVTVEPKDHEPLPVLQRDDISVEVDRKPARVVSWTRLTGDVAPLQIYIAIDDAESTDLAIQFGDLKDFINSQPSTTEIGIAYLRYGAAEIVQAPTADHARAARALRLPVGELGIDASPYLGVEDLIKKWTPVPARREMLLISSGVDPYYQSPDSFDPYLQEAIETAQKAGIAASSIYYSRAGHFGHSFLRVTWGQNYLSMLDEELGGEFYGQGTGDPVALKPFLNEFSSWLGQQYLLTIADSDSGKAELKPVRVSSTKPRLSLVHASKIYLGGAMPVGAVNP